jgi:hypothetical protein
MAEKVIEATPQGLEVLQELKEKVPEAALTGINQAIQAQVKMMQEHIEKIDDQVTLERYKNSIETNKAVGDEIKKIGPPDFFKVMENRGRELQKAQEQSDKIKEQKIQEMQQQILQAPEGALPSIMPTVVSPATVEKIQEFKKEVLEKYGTLPPVGPTTSGGVVPGPIEVVPPSPEGGGRSMPAPVQVVPGETMPGKPPEGIRPIPMPVPSGPIPAPVAPTPTTPGELLPKPLPPPTVAPMPIPPMTGGGGGAAPTPAPAPVPGGAGVKP